MGEHELPAGVKNVSVPTIAGRIILAVILGFLLTAVESVFRMSVFNPEMPAFANPWIAEALTTAAMIVIAVLVIAAIGRGRLTFYGFTAGRNIPYSQLITISLLFAVPAAVINVFIPGEGLTFMDDKSLLYIIVFAWIGRSVLEEVIHRGLVQTLMWPLVGLGINIGKIRLSLTVLVSGIFFGLLHLMLLSMGTAPARVIVIVVFAISLGLIAGYYREKTGSLVPAILVHALFNISGTVVGLITGALNL